MPSRLSLHTGDAARLISPAEAADLLSVSPDTLLGWIAEGRVPYIELPRGDRAEYRIPMQGLLASLTDAGRLGGGVETLDDSLEQAGVTQADVEEAIAGE